MFENGNLVNGLINPEKSELEDPFDEFVKEHSYQLLTSAVPENLWRSLFSKLQDQVYDAGEYFQIFQSISSEDSVLHWQVNLIADYGISPSDSNCIFLIDHAWTYQANEARNSLIECEGLLERMCKLMNITFNESDLDTHVEEVLNRMWEYNGTYSIGNLNIDDRIPIWYIMDEFGSRIQHDGDPNCRVVPFYHLPHSICYSILFPIKKISAGEEVTRNYVESPPVDSLYRDAQMLPWFPEDLTHVDILQDEPPSEFFMSGREPEALPTNDFLLLPLPSDRKIKVFADYEYITNYLTDQRFEIVNDQEKADIIWLSIHFKEFAKLSETPWKRINQFPLEHLITTKDMLAVISRRCNCSENSLRRLNSSCPSWMLPTFCLKRELPKFVSQFQSNEKRDLDNTWIIKPWNLARGLDHTVTNNLNHIIRLFETGPKIAQKYLHNPVLFYRDDIDSKVKFDLRFVVLLLNVKPLKVAVYKNFWIRFANKAFDLSNFEDYQKHFTVNNYNNEFLLQMRCDEFIAKFENQYQSYLWGDIEKKIHQMMKEVFEGATKYDVPKGIPNNPQCSASYGFDIMLDWGSDNRDDPVIQPKLLEVNFMPDCKRACEYYPNFFNDLFSVMFLDDETCSSIKIL